MGAASATEAPGGVPDERLEALFRGPLEGFTSSRNELAKELRSDGERAAADWVKGLRKPTRAAWLVNQLAERKPAEVKRLLEAGEALRRGQEEMLAGTPDREALREAARREQKAVDSLVRTAEAIGREHKAGGQVLDRVAETLQAASSDPEVARAIDLGRLEREQRAVSIGLVGAAGPEAPTKGRAPKGKAAKGRAAKGRAEAREAGREAAERRAREQRARRRKAAEREVGAAEKKVERERTAVERARDALEEREKRLRDAEHNLRAARRDLDRI